ncbi:glycosyltransferase [Neisseriaceae bacterium B1]
MKFSVLMSVYEREQPEFLRECLASLVAQTRLADEIVVVLDGRLPKTLLDVLAEFQAALPLKIVPMTENVGLGLALNEGISHCSYEWIFRMDTDDIALPQRFEQQCAFLEQQPEIVLLGGQIVEFLDNPNETTAARRVPFRLPEIVEFSKKRNPFNHMTVAYQKAAVQQVSGYVHHWYMEDYNLWLRMLAAGFQAANLSENLVAARTGAGMLGRRRGWAYIKSEWQLFELKRQLGLQTIFSGLLCFILRTLPRLLPEKILQKIYQIIRLT